MVDLKNEVVAALKEAAKPVDTNFLSTLRASGFDYCFLKVTETGLAKNIFDANKELRELLKKLGIHEYEDQDFGQENAVMVPGFFGPRRKSLEVHLYRAERRGDLRISFSGIKNYAKVGDTLVIILREKVFYVLNTNDEKLDKTLSFLENVETPLPTEGGGAQDTNNTKTTTPIIPDPAGKKIPDEPERPLDERIRVELGSDPKNQTIIWDPFHPAKGLVNSHMVVLGASGAGKTQTMKVLIRELSAFNVKPIILDFNEDFVGVNFTQSIRAKLHNVLKEGLDFNPLAIQTNGKTTPQFQTYQIAGMIAKIFSLGTQQEANLRSAIISTYESREIDKDACINSDINFPTFKQLEPFVRDTDDQKLYNRIGVLFDFNLFRGQTGFQEGFLQEGHVINLSQLPTEETKKAMAAMVLMGIYNTLLGLSHSPKNIRLAIIVDEAHKVANLKEMKNLLKEGRKYGCSVLLASQEAKDFNESVYSNMASLLCLKLIETENSKMIAKQIGTESSCQSLAEKIRNLEQFNGYFKNDHYNSMFADIKIKNYFDRFGSWGAD